MNLPHYLHSPTAGDIRIVGSRIGLYHVVQKYREGMTPAMIAEEYPTLSIFQVERAIGFYLENRSEVDDYVRDYEVELERQFAAGHRVNVDGLRARLATIQNGDSEPRA